MSAPGRADIPLELGNVVPGGWYEAAGFYSRASLVRCVAEAAWGMNVGIGPSIVGFGWQKIHFVIGGDAHDLGWIGEVVKLVEERFQFLHRGNPEQGARRLV